MVDSAGPTYLGIDLGTTNIKALVVARDGTILSSASAPIGISYGADGSAEQDLEEIWRATLTAITQAAAGRGESVRAIGVSSQGGALQLLEPDGRPRGPVVGWQDARGGLWDHEATELKGRRWFERHSGYPKGTSAVGQLLRLGAEGTLTASSGVGWVGDLVVGRLCGRRAQDATSLSEAGLLNPGEGREDAALLEMVGVEATRLPDLIAADEAAGILLPEVAQHCGLPAGIPVGPAVHDQYAAALGAGAVKAGDTMLGTGTAWVLLAVTDRLKPPVAGIALSGRHPVSGLYGQMLSMVNGGSCVDWVLRTFDFRSADGSSIDEITAAVEFGSKGLRFRPLLSEGGGAGLPPDLAGRIDGLRLGHTGAHLLRAVIEGLACELGRYLHLARESGIETATLAMCGKAATSSVTPQIVADVTGVPVDCLVSPETSPLGAAVLARCLVEPAHDIASLADEMKPRVRRVEPGSNSRAGSQMLLDYLRSSERLTG